MQRFTKSLSYLNSLIVSKTAKNYFCGTRLIHGNYKNELISQVGNQKRTYLTVPVRRRCNKRLNCCACKERTPTLLYSKDSSLNITLKHGWSIRTFRTTAKCSAMPGLFVLLFKPLSKIFAFIFGRGFRKWYLALPKNKQVLIKAYIQRNWKKITVVSCAAVGVGGIYYESHVSETPITRRRRFLMFSDNQFREIANYEFKAHMDEFEDSILPTKHPAYTRVLKVANKLLEANRDLKQIYDKQWSVTVVDQDIKNVFVLACGQVFVFTGMLSMCTNDDQLGIILGHEMAHCILNHAIELLSWGHFLDIILLVPVALMWAFIPSDSVALITQWLFSKVTEMLLTLPYGRQLESEADEVGLHLAAKACFDVRESSAFWGKMALLGETIDEGLKSQTDWLSTHPSHETRQVKLNQLIPSAIRLREACQCPRLPSSDPRDCLPELKETIRSLPVISKPVR